MKDNRDKNPCNLKVATFYGFFSLGKTTLNSLQLKLATIAEEYDVRGSILLAIEGVNGTICGAKEGVSVVLKQINRFIDLNEIEIKYSWTQKQAFRRFKVKIKNEIVTMGVEGVNPLEFSGAYIEPKDWNNYLEDPSTLVIDTRNEYEIGVGTFSGSVNPHTDIFRDFPSWADNNLKILLEENNATKIAMFCTGGIRCEKATAYLTKQGFPEVHHLHGGILRYLEEIPEEESKWDGECFVFDQRVSLSHDLSPGIHKLCYACGMPLSPKDCDRSEYVTGIQCHHCVNSFTDEDRARFAERQKHIREISKRQPGNTQWPNSSWT